MIVFKNFNLFVFLSIFMFYQPITLAAAPCYSNECRVPKPKLIAIGERHICAIDNSGVLCLGSNDNGQTDVPTDLVNPIQVSAGGFNTCALDENGVHCWGNTPKKYQPPSHFINPIQVEMGQNFTCVLDNNGVQCWGTNSYGQTDIPIGLHNPIQISAGEDHICALGDSKVICWGSNKFGQIDVPTDLINPTQVSAGRDHSCAIDNTGVRCWGGSPIVTYKNAFNNKPVWKRFPPKKVMPPTDLKNPIQISAGNTQTCALDDSGVRCWGKYKPDNDYGMGPYTASDWVPKNLSNPTYVSTSTGGSFIGGTYSCALDDNGVQCWGNDSYKYSLDSITDLQNPSQVIAGGDRSCVIDDARVHCWGANDQTPVPSDLRKSTQLGMGERESCVLKNREIHCWWSPGTGESYTPSALQKTRLKVGHTCAKYSHGMLNPSCGAENNKNHPSQKITSVNLTNPIQISIGGKHGCALDTEKIHCWGDNEYGQTDVPTDLKNPTQISLGDYRSCALDSGKVRCWGRDSHRHNSPKNIQNPTLLNIGTFYSCVLDDNGVQCWGGDSSLPASRNVPNDLINPTQIEVGTTHICVLDDEGVKCWGKNDDGQTEVPSELLNPTQISAGSNHTCALDDHGVKCWGKNNAGQTNIPRKLNLPWVNNFNPKNKFTPKCLFSLNETATPPFCLVYAPQWWKW